ncbi:hypothetical protein N7474_008192 [Penicillium riverlandense]|uniref:uncharacterized protein n=1 Tax=Penicillium riverlandense TaxID=1903569 RepID=UPI0025494370|nr:uncharacterized protein N7474_008192 [Penicillium riverlandense]KAJ5811891.1 hypothetical protein N7474_008192 [Penicillium riverlandense]
MMNSPLHDTLTPDDDNKDCPELPTPKCSDIFRITRAEPWLINTSNWWLFSSEPKLRFQLNQSSSWKGGSLFPIYNIWSPAYFGISLSQPDFKTYKLSCNDLIVSSYEDDTRFLKSGDTRPVPFDLTTVVGGIDVDYPPFLCCQCCFRYRGWVTLASSERWRFDEIWHSYYQFQRVHERMNAREFPKIYHVTLLWECYRDWKPEYGKAPADLPFAMDKDTRVCRINPLRYQERHWDPSTLVAPVIAIMNPDGIIFIDGLKEATEIETANLRDLVLMTGLTVAKFERRVWDK